MKNISLHVKLREGGREIAECTVVTQVMIDSNSN